MKYGFDPKLIEITPEDWTLGSIVSEVLKEDKDWSKYLPLYEPQSKDNWDTYGCTCFGTLNQVETLLNFLEGKEYNFSERYPYNIVKINPPGASPHSVYEAIRKNGLLTQEELPFTNTLEEFKKPRPMTEELLSKGKLWLNDYTLEHEWLISPTHDDIVANLKYSPIALSVTAWYYQDGLAVDANLTNTHWCLCFRAEKVNAGQILYVFDSYDHSIKKLDPSHKIMFAKKISIKKKAEVEIQEYTKTSPNPFIQIIKRIWTIVKSFWQ